MPDRTRVVEKYDEAGNLTSRETTIEQETNNHRLEDFLATQRRRAPMNEPVTLGHRRLPRPSLDYYDNMRG